MIGVSVLRHRRLRWSWWWLRFAEKSREIRASAGEVRSEKNKIAFLL